MANLKALRRSCCEMAEAVIDALGVEFEHTSELQRQVLANFTFGMVFALGQIHELTPAQIHALLLLVLNEPFKYSPKQAAAFADDLIRAAADRSHHDTMHAILHRGIDGHRQWESGNAEGLRENLLGVLRLLEGGPRRSSMTPGTGP